jgi:protein-disulfide isomerase
MSAPAASDLVVPVASSDHILGPTNAVVTVVEYGDFECPTCKLAYPSVKLLLKHLGPQMRFVYRHFPLEQPHPNALLAAEATESAAAQGKFWEMHDLLFDNQPRLEKTHLGEYAQRIQLDLPRFMTELDTHMHVDRVRADLAGGAKSRVRSTPGFFVNGRIVDVSFGMRALFDAAEAALRST